MLEDISFLKTYIKNYYTPLSLVEKRTGTSINNEFARINSSISKEESIEFFLEKVRECLNSINDPHSGIVNKSKIKWFVSNSYLSPASNVTLKDTLNADYFVSCLSDSVFSKIKCQFACKYIDGKYYNLRAFEYDNKTFESGEIVSKIDGIPINDFINKNRVKFYFTNWDPIYKQWYCELFKATLPLIGKQQFTLTIGNKTVKLDCTKPINILAKEHSKTNHPNIFKVDSATLYIRMPIMMNNDWYINELLKFDTTDIKKIIIDIRDNPGGDDSVWQDLLESIIDEPLHYTYNVQIPIIMKSLETLKEFGEIKVKDNEAYVEKQRVLHPNKKSIRFSGNIYILQNKYTYSAAAALASVAMQSNRLILIGEPSTAIAGYTFPPIMLKLPNSGVVFNLAFSFDKTGGEKNPFMDQVEKYIRSDVPSNDYLNSLMNLDIYSQDFISHKDSLVGYVIKYF